MVFWVCDEVYPYQIVHINCMKCFECQSHFSKFSLFLKTHSTCNLIFSHVLFAKWAFCWWSNLLLLIQSTALNLQLLSPCNSCSSGSRTELHAPGFRVLAQEPETPLLSLVNWHIWVNWLGKTLSTLHFSQSSNRTKWIMWSNIHEAWDSKTSYQNRARQPLHSIACLH